MKVTHLSTSDIDGGAARAAYRLHKGLIADGIDSSMLVRAKFSDDSTVIANKTLVARLGSKLDNWPVSRYKERDGTIFSPQWFPDSVVSRVRQIDPDIIHLHWICNGFLRIESLAQFGKPIVWTLHDMWPFTGGCHYTKGCNLYREGCGNCPQLGSTKLHDLSYETWQRKLKAWKNLNLTIVTPSRWLAKCAESSPLFNQLRIEIIPNGLDTDCYRPYNKLEARKTLGLPQEKSLVLFGSGSSSGEARKGFQYLLSALQKLDSEKWREQIELVVFGRSDSAESLPINFKTHYLGNLETDQALAKAYSSADVFVAPSVQDNLPNTVVESLSCGTACVAFDIGGMPDIIQHKKNGFLAPPFDIDELARGIVWTLHDESRKAELFKNSRAHAIENFELASKSSQYNRLYQQLIGNGIDKRAETKERRSKCPSTD